MPLFTPRGSLVALVTPFDRKGRIDWKSLESLALWHMAEGTDGIVCCGTTGEAMTLSDSEKKKIVAFCVNAVQSRIPIIACSGSADTLQSARLTEQMGKLGTSSSLIFTPYYNKPTQKGCIFHVTEIAKAGLPVIIYNNPGRSVIKLTAETVAEMAQIPGVVAIKESSGDLEMVRKIRQLCSISVLSGDEDLTYQILAEGGVGSISAIGNVIPGLWRRMIHLALARKMEAARKIADRCAPLCKALFLETNPQCVKFAVSCLGKCENTLRLPLMPVAKASEQAIKQVLLELSLPQFTVQRMLASKPYGGVYKMEP